MFQLSGFYYSREKARPPGLGTGTLAIQEEV